MRRHWWRVVAGLLLVFAGLVLTLQQLELIVIDPSFVGTAALFVGALVFLTLWLSNQKEWWPLIPGLIMLAWALGTVMADLGAAAWVVSLVGFTGSALPFLLIFARNRRTNWWALIPGGVLGIVGVATVLGQLVGDQWTDVLVLLGIALAFLLVFVTNRRRWWALIPAGVMAIVGISVSPLGSYSQLVWAGLLIVAGLALVAYSLLGRA